MKINALGDACPIPVIKARRALERLGSEGVLEIRVDNEIATQNLNKMAVQMGFGFECSETSRDEFTVVIRLGDGGAFREPADEGLGIEDGSKSGEGALIVIADEGMGTGDEALGKNLMKAFIYTLTEVAQLPKALVFYNSGVHITAKGSGSLEDLRAMEARGCRILSCGACVGFYKLGNDLGVGEITDMFEIVNMMNAASKVISV